jgi:hypothetical protein
LVKAKQSILSPLPSAEFLCIRTIFMDCLRDNIYEPVKIDMIRNSIGAGLFINPGTDVL